MHTAKPLKCILHCTCTWPTTMLSSTVHVLACTHYVCSTCTCTHCVCSTCTCTFVQLPLLARTPCECDNIWWCTLVCIVIHISVCTDTVCTDTMWHLVLQHKWAINEQTLKWLYNNTLLCITWYVCIDLSVFHHVNHTVNHTVNVLVTI